MARNLGIVTWLAVSGLLGCSGGGGSGEGATTDMTLESVATARLVRTTSGDELLPPDSVVRTDPETGQLLEILEPGTSLVEIGTSSDSFGLAPRDAALVLTFTEVVDPASVDAQSIQLRDNRNGHSVPFRSFTSGRLVILDPIIDLVEAKEGGLPVQLTGWPAGGSAHYANLELRLPAQEGRRLRNRSGRPIRTRPEDRRFGRPDIVVQFRSGGDFDESRGYLPDREAPFITVADGREYRADRDRNRIDIAKVLRTDTPPRDDVTRIVDEPLGIDSAPGAIIDFEVLPPIALTGAPIADGLLRLGPVSRPVFADQASDLDGDGEPESGVFSSGFVVDEEDTGLIAEPGFEQSFESGGPFTLRHGPLSSVRLFEEGHPENGVVADDTGRFGTSGQVDLETGVLTGTVIFPELVAGGARILASYRSTRFAWVDYATGQISGAMRLPEDAPSGEPLVASYGFVQKTRSRLEEVTSHSRIGLRFSEPIDPRSLGAFSNFFILDRADRPESSLPSRAAYGSLELDIDLRTVWFTPPIAGWGPDSRALALVVLLDDPDTAVIEGPHDLAGNGIAGGVQRGALFDDGQARLVAQFDWTSAGSIDAETTERVMEDFSPRQLWDAVGGNTHDRRADDGIIRGGLPRRWQWCLNDPSEGGLTPNFAPGVTTPFSPTGARLQTVLPATLLGAGSPSGLPWLLEGIDWSPINQIVFGTTFSQFEMRIGHSTVIPTPGVPGSGLSPTFAANYKTMDPVGAITVIPEGPYVLQTASSPSTPFFYPYPRFQQIFEYNGQDSLLIDIGVAADSAAQPFNGYEIQVAATLTPFSRVLSVGSAAAPIRNPWSLVTATGVPGAPIQTPGDSVNYIHRFHFSEVDTIATSPYYRLNDLPPGTTPDFTEWMMEPSTRYQPVGTHVTVLFYGARDENGLGATGWVEDLDAIDGYPFVRVRLIFRSNIRSDTVPTLESFALAYQLRND
ncbi:MAG: hypothetical protein RL885_01905 [Planctomycetota bacterium]